MLYEVSVKLHLQHMKFLNASPGTITNHACYLKSFGVFLAENGIEDVMAVTPKVIDRYQSEQLTHRHHNKQVSVATHIHRLVALRRLFDTLIEKNIVLINVARKIPLPHFPQKMPPRLPTTKEIHRMLNRMPLRTPIECRNRCAIELFYATGIRRNELAGLRASDLNLELSEVRVIGKGLKDRTLPLTPRASQCLREYVRRIRKKLAPGPLLFPNMAGGLLQDRDYRCILDGAAARAKIRRKITTHLFRHVLATELLRNGANLRSIQEYLGHFCIRTTTQYAHVLGSDLKKVHARTHPREKGA